MTTSKKSSPNASPAAAATAELAPPSSSDSAAMMRRSAPLDPFVGKSSEPLERRSSLEEAHFEAALRGSLSGLTPSDDDDDRGIVMNDSTVVVVSQKPAVSLKEETPLASSHVFLDDNVLFDPLSVLQPPVYFNPSEYVQTASGNKVAINSVLCGSQKIHMAGRSIIHVGVVLRGDLASLRIGRFVSVGSGTTLRPALKPGEKICIPITIGDYVTIGRACVINAALISNHVVIGDNCVIVSDFSLYELMMSASSPYMLYSKLFESYRCCSSMGKRCILKDSCIILPGSVIASDTVVPPMCAFGGIPGNGKKQHVVVVASSLIAVMTIGRFIGELFESAAIKQKKQAIQLYKCFSPIPSK